MEITHADKISELDIPNIWIEWGNLAKLNNACNLGAGFPNFPLHPDLKEELVKAAEDPSTCWYTRPAGHPRLVDEVIATYSPLFGRKIEASEVLTAIGAYQGIYWVYEAFLTAGDEVIAFDPMFDAYHVNCKLGGAKLVSVPLKLELNSWVLDKDLLIKSFNSRTKLVIINTPHNPTGKVFNRDELELIAKLAKQYNCLVLADDVYDRYVFEGHEHLRIASFPGMWERTITVFSAGKMFGVTGWRTGWALGPANLIEKLLRIALCDVFVCSTILQEAIAGMLQRQRQRVPPKETYYQWAGKIFTENFEKLKNAFNEADMPVVQAEGGYFMVVDCSKRKFCFQNDTEYQSSEEPLDVKVAKGIVNNFKLSILPLSLFYSPNSTNKSFSHLRVCFAKSSETIDQAVEIIKSFW